MKICFINNLFYVGHYAEAIAYELAKENEVVVITNKSESPENSVSLVSGDMQLFLPLNELVDVDKEIARLNDEKKKLEGELKRVNGKLNNEKFVGKAPEAVVASEREKKEKYQLMMDKVLDQIKNYEGMKK